MQPTLTPREFVDKWKQVTVKERSGYQEHFLDLCRLVGHPSPLDADPTGETYSFEAGAAKQGGGQGFADVWKRGFFALEYKGKHADLDKAYDQLLKYRESLLNPPLLIVSDLEKIIIHTNFTNTVKQVTTLTPDDLLTAVGMERLRNVFETPDAFKVAKTTEQVTREAAEKFAKIAELLRRYGADPHQAAHFLIRILFCLFAEDVGLLPKDLFRKLVENTLQRPKSFTQGLRSLFSSMASGGMYGADAIPHFNGGLFDSDTVIDLDSDSLRVLYDVSGLDWSSIEPSIFGTLFERSLDPNKRAQLGAHFTSREDILLIVEPVLMQPLLRRWAEVQQQVGELVQKRNQVASNQRGKLNNQIAQVLMAFSAELAAVRVLDPACGSGNFLYVALRLLLDLEKRVIAFANESGISSFFPLVSPKQIYGIEKDEYAYELAQITVWIGYIQWLRDNGFGAPPEPILRKLENIHNMDAILHIDAEGQASEPVWPQAEVIVGNPPFLGVSRIRRELGDVYAETLFKQYLTRVPAASDLVCYWFEKARLQIEKYGTKRAGLIATQAIRSTLNRAVLERIKQTGGLFLAYQDRPWILDGAAVRVSIIGFDNDDEQIKTIDGLRVATVNADLSSTHDLTQAIELEENAHIAFQGPSPKGPFDIDESIAQKMLASPSNVNGRGNEEVVRPVASAADLVQGGRNAWTIDFGLMSIDEASQYELPFEYVRKIVYPIRKENRRAAYAEKWWQYAEARRGMRKALEGRSRYIATPRVAKHRLFVWLPIRILANDRTFIFAREDDYFFGILHSRVHEGWSLATSSRHGVGNDPTYNNSTCFETFPFPWPPGQEPTADPKVQSIASAAKELVDKRDNWLNAAGNDPQEKKKRTLTNLYNQRPTWLDLAHKKLDKAVLDAYGWPHDIADEEILSRLLGLNLERAGKGQTKAS